MTSPQKNVWGFSMKTLSKILGVVLAGLLAGSPNVVWGAAAEGLVGPITSSDGAVAAHRFGRDRALIVQEGHGRFQELSVRGNAYTGMNAAGTTVTTQAGLSATTPALTLWNPVGSGKNLVLNTVSVVVSTSGASTVDFILAYSTSGAPTATTKAQVQQNLIGSFAQPVGQIYSIATLVAAPQAIRYMGTLFGAAGVAVVTPFYFPLVDHVDGEIVVGPGSLITLQTSAAIPVLASFTWEEVPL